MVSARITADHVSKEKQGSQLFLKILQIRYPSAADTATSDRGESGVRSAVKQERQEVADEQPFAKCDPEHLVFAQTKPLPDSLDVGLVPKQDRAGLLHLLRLFGCFSHKSILPLTNLRCTAYFLQPGRSPALLLLF